MNAPAERIELPRSEVYNLAAVDSIFYCREFFPKTFRQSSPEYHRDFWSKFDNPAYDFFGAEIYRGGAKTTLSRAGISKRVAFGISRNILSVAISETMAAHTVRWLKKQVENNTYWTSMFGLQKGGKWSDDWIEINHTILGITINVIAKGMTSSLRGLNLDDWRPDFIFCDDISNEETTGTEEQRNKNSDLFFGAIVPSLAPRSEAPLRKLVLAQTGLHKEDIINKAHNDPTFLTVIYPKLIDKFGVPQSTWEERFPTVEAVQEREDYLRRGQYHVYLREFGCKIISRETSPLDAAHLRYWKSLPTNLIYYIGLDPATDSQNPKAHKSAISVIGEQPKTGDVFLVEYYAQKGKNPDEIWEWLLERYLKFRPEKTGVETIAFQKMLAWYFRNKMLEAKRFFHITEVQDKRAKPQRIMQAFSLASHGRFWVSENHTDFIARWTDWDGISDWDLGDATAQAITLANPWLAVAGQVGDETDGNTPSLDRYPDEKEIPDLVYEGGCP